MEYMEDDVCNKSLDDVINCTIEYSKLDRTALKPEAVAVPLTFAFIFLVGVTGNVLLILNFARHKKLNTPHNALVVNLAAGDLLMLLIGLPFNSIWYTVPDWPFGDFLCRLSRFAETMATAVTICTLTVLSVERFFIVTGRRRQQTVTSLPLMVVLAVWLFALLLALPDFISPIVLTPPGHVHNDTRRASEFCLDFNPNWGKTYPKVNIMSKFLLLFVLPLMVIAPCYVGLAFHLVFKMFGARGTPTSKTPLRAAVVTSAGTCDDSHHDVRGVQHDDEAAEASNVSNGPRGRKTPTHKRRRLAVTVLGLVMCFVLCWLPRYVFLLWFHYDPSLFNHFWHVFKMVSFCLMFSNSAVNPFVFYVLDLHFRAFVHAAVLCRKTGGYLTNGREGRGRGAGGTGGGGGGRGDNCLANAETTAMEMSVTVDRKTCIAMSPLPAASQRVDSV